MRQLIFATLLIASTAHAQKKEFEYFLAGSQSDAHVTTKPAFLLAGGGKSDDASFRWFLERAGHGDILILCASGSDAYHSYLRSLAAVDSVETIVFHSREDSSDPFVLDRIRKADGIFFAGGDQWNYVRFWKETPVMTELNAAVARGIPIGGTSAGLAVLGEWSFAAEHDTVTSAVALADPFHEKVSLERAFLKLPDLRCSITDSHFAKRDRMGRLLVFLARMRSDACEMPRGIAVDEGVALMLEANGSARVSGTGAVYFIQLDGHPKMERGKAMTAGPYHVIKVSDDNTSSSYDLNVEAGNVKSTVATIYGAGK